VTLTKHDHRKPADSHSVLIVVQIPGHTITAAKHHETFEEAIRLAFEALAVELERIREKRASHEVDVNAPPDRGVVTKLFPKEGYGFIVLEDGTEVYFHENSVRDAVFEQMDGMEVSLELWEDRPISVQLPEQVEATIVEADAVVKGQTASSSYKPAVLDNGVRVMVPPHIESGTRIVVDVYERTYVGKAG